MPRKPPSPFWPSLCLATCGLGLWMGGTAQSQSLDILLNCSSCHTLDRSGQNGMAPRYPVLNGQPVRYLIAQLDAYRTGARQHDQMSQTAHALGAGGAPAMAKMYASSYLPQLSFKGNADQMEMAIDIHRNGVRDRSIPACKSCHQLDDADSINMSARNAPRIHGQPRTYLAGQLRAYADGSRTTGALQRMQSYSSQLTAAEIDALSEYYAAYLEKAPQ